MSYFISVTTAERDYFLDEANFRYMRFVIDPSGTPVVFTPMKISCDASADYQQWKFDIKNKLSVYSVGQYANEPAVVQFSDDGTNWTKIFTGFVSDEGFRRTRGFITDDQLSMTFVDATKRKGTKHKPNPVLLAGFKIVDTATTSASILHYLATQMGVTVNATTINYTKVIVELGESTVWEELKKLQNTFHADMYFDVDGYLLFVSPFDTGYSDPTAEWTFQGDPANSVTGAASWIKGKLEEIYLPIRANYAFSNFDELEQLSSQVIYKNTESYNSVTDQISIEIAAGEYWPGGTSATDLARLKYVDPESGEEFPFATSVITPTLGAAGSGSDIESTGGTLVLTSFDGSTTATSQNANASEIILQNTGGVTCTIKKLTVRGTPYRLKSEQEIKFTDATISNDYDYVEKEIDGKYVTSSSQVFDTLYRVVQEGKGRPRQFRFSSAFMPWIQRNAIVNVQPHDESAVRCRIDSYQHRNKGKTLQGMYTSIICTELGTYTPTGSPLVKTEGTVSPAIAKLNAISPNAGATYRSASTSAPTNPQYGDWWYQTDTKLNKRYSGSAWEDVGASPLETTVTSGVAFENASGNVQILNDGTIKAVDGEFSGTLTAASGQVGDMGSELLVNTSTTIATSSDTWGDVFTYFSTLTGDEDPFVFEATYNSGSYSSLIWNNKGARTFANYTISGTSGSFSVSSTASLVADFVVTKAYSRTNISGILQPGFIEFDQGIEDGSSNILATSQIHGMCAGRVTSLGANSSSLIMTEPNYDSSYEWEIVASVLETGTNYRTYPKAYSSVSGTTRSHYVTNTDIFALTIAWIAVKVLAG